MALPLPASFVAPIGRAPSSPTSRFTCMYICDGDHAVRSIDDEGGARDRGLGPGHTQHADCSHGFLLASSFRFSLTLCPLCRQPPLLPAICPVLSSYNCTVTLLTSCQFISHVFLTATLVKRGLGFLFLFSPSNGEMFSPVSCHIYTYWWSRQQATNSSTMRTCTVTMEGNCAICPRTISLAGGSLPLSWQGPNTRQEGENKAVDAGSIEREKNREE